MKLRRMGHLTGVVLALCLVLVGLRLLGRTRPPKVKASRAPKAQASAIGIYTGPSPLELKPAGQVQNPVLTAAQVTDCQAGFLADPFMVKEGDTWYLFFETANRSPGHKKGEIGLATSPDGFHWTYKQLVLAEPFHLSYPYVFKWGSDYYMIPESIQAGGIRLYKASDFPTKWVFQKVLIPRKLVDPSIFRHAGKWWLLAGERNHILRLFFADELTGPWTEHPKSPVVEGNPHIARPGGRVIEWNGRLFRFPQDDAPFYGVQLFAFEITELTPVTYKEKPALDGPVVKPTGSGWNAKGMHQVDLHELPDHTWIACVDGH